MKSQRLRRPLGGFHYISQDALPTATQLVSANGSALDGAEVEDLSGLEGEEPSGGTVSNPLGLSSWW